MSWLTGFRNTHAQFLLKPYLVLCVHCQCAWESAYYSAYHLSMLILLFLFRVAQQYSFIFTCLLDMQKPESKLRLLFGVCQSKLQYAEKPVPQDPGEQSGEQKNSKSVLFVFCCFFFFVSNWLFYLVLKQKNLRVLVM